MADLVACRFSVPVKDLLVDKRTGSGGQGKTGGHKISGAFRAIGKTEQPVRRNPECRGACADHMGVGEPRPVPFEQLRYGGSINANGPCKAALSAAVISHCTGQTSPKLFCAVAFVDIFRHMVIFITYCEIC